MCPVTSHLNFFMLRIKKNDYNERCRGQGRELVELETGCRVRDFVPQIQTDLKNNFEFRTGVATFCGVKCSSHLAMKEDLQSATFANAVKFAAPDYK